jgi:hypothetical protein
MNLPYINGSTTYTINTPKAEVASGLEQMGWLSLVVNASSVTAFHYFEGTRSLCGSLEVQPDSFVFSRTMNYKGIEPCSGCLRELDKKKDDVNKRTTS